VASNLKPLRVKLSRQVLSNFGMGGAETWLISLLRHIKLHAAALGAILIYARYSRKTLPSFVATSRKTLAEGRYNAIHDNQEFTAGWHFLFGTGELPPARIGHLYNPMSHQASYGLSPSRRAAIHVGNRLIASHATHLSAPRGSSSQNKFSMICANGVQDWKS
jgi:hypothetical protein